MITTNGNNTSGPQQPIMQRQQLHQHNLGISSQSLTAEMSDPNCPLTHQYHYIQYPAYYQLMQDRLITSSTTCRCPCSCNPNRAQSSPGVDSQMAVSVIVHSGGSGGNNAGNVDAGNMSNNKQVKVKSEQSLITHSYQALNHGDNRDENYPSEEKQLNVDVADANTSCSCDLECTCENVIASSLPTKSRNCAKVGLSELMLGADEITVSESDNNSIIVKRKGRELETEQDVKKSNTWCAHKSNNITHGVRGRMPKCTKVNYSSSQIDIYSDEEDDGFKIQDQGILEDDQRPPLPPRPRPLPRPRNVVVNMSAHRNGNGIKKYVVWCLICGGFSCLLGVLFLGVYFLLHSYTITVGNFETVPTFVPATLLILTGLCIMSLARRRNRYSYLIKLSGACGLISALTCALVTVTTTVLHMSRLQALRECEYAQKTRTCTCYSDMIESQVERVDKEGVRLVFDSLSDCGVVHGSLYSCLRAIFGLSVAGVLIAVFSCMLVYQLLSHERKKMYWEQLELRCRSLYTSQQGPPPPNMAALAGRANVCRCCEQCHAHRQMTMPQPTPAAYPWDDGGAGGPRFWTGQPPGNFYSPNPGGDDLHNNSGASSGACRNHNLTTTRSRVGGWSWPRMPWQRNSPLTSNRFRQTPSSPDSQYGFSNTTAAVPPINEGTLSNGASDDIMMLSQPSNHAQTFNVIASGNWGPPPPYSDPNSPSRRGYYYMHAVNSVCPNAASQSTTSGVADQPHGIECRSHYRSAYIDGNQGTDGTAYCAAQSSSMRSLTSKRQAANGFKSKGGDYENTFSDSDGCGGGSRDRFSNTLPTRKVKKRVEAGIKSIGPNSQSSQRVNVQNVFTNNVNLENDMSMANNEHSYHELVETADNTNMPGQNAGINMTRVQSIRRHQSVGVENSAFQNSADAESTPTTHTDNQESRDPTESEVYFADVSSCCNISVKNDNYYDDTNQKSNKLCRNHHSTSAHSPIKNNSDEDYLAQRFGKRENSIRSRLPFPQVACIDDYPSKNTMQKEISRQSMCSIESEAKTEFTDLSPSTPCENKMLPSQFGTVPQCDNSINGELAPPKFVASFPYHSESQSLEAHRRSTRNINEYEIINEPVMQPTCKPVNFPTSPKAKRSLKCKNSASSKTQNVKKLNIKEKRFEKSAPPYPQSDLEWSDSSNCTNDRQRL